MLRPWEFDATTHGRNSSDDYILGYKYKYIYIYSGQGLYRDHIPFFPTKNELAAIVNHGGD